MYFQDVFLHIDLKTCYCLLITAACGKTVCLHSTECQELVQKFTAAMNSIVENFEEEGTSIKWGNLSEPLRAQVGETKITEGLAY